MAMVKTVLLFWLTCCFAMDIGEFSLCIIMENLTHDINHKGQKMMESGCDVFFQNKDVIIIDDDDDDEEDIEGRTILEEKVLEIHGMADNNNPMEIDIGANDNMHSNSY